MSSLTHSKIQRYVYLSSVASTNEFLLDYTSKSKPSGNICVYSYEQTAGKGQIGRFWYSGKGENLCLSYLLHFQKLPVKDHFLLNMAVCLSVRDFIQKLLPECRVLVKWPNDIYVGGRKIAGLLMQNQVRGKVISSAIIGIGINVNEQAFPSDLPKAVSLIKIRKRPFRLFPLMCQFEPFLFSGLQSGLADRARLTDRYLEHLLGLGEERAFRDPKEGLVNGIIRGINQDGKLRVMHGQKMRLYNNHEIEFII